MMRTRRQVCFKRSCKTILCVMMAHAAIEKSKGVFCRKNISRMDEDINSIGEEWII